MSFRKLTILVMIWLMCCGVAALGQGYNTGVSGGMQGFQGGISRPASGARSVSGLSGFGEQSAAGGGAYKRTSANPLAAKPVTTTSAKGNRAGRGRIGLKKMPASLSGMLTQPATARSFTGGRVGRQLATDEGLGGQKPLFGGAGALTNGRIDGDFAARMLRASEKSFLQKSRGMGMRSAFSAGRSLTRRQRLAASKGSPAKRGMSAGTPMFKKRAARGENGNPLFEHGIIPANNPASQFLK